MLTIAEVQAYLETLAPLALAESWDNVGLLLGDAGRTVERIMTCLTLTPETVQEAVEEGADLVVTHHPVLFKAVQKLSSATADGRLLLPLLARGTAVVSHHTAYDNCVGGINDQLCAALGLDAIRPLRPKPANQVKIVVFVPDADLAKVSDALFQAGAGVIGAYSQCSYRLLGTGTFLGSAESNPTIGKRGQREEVQEWRLEVVCPAELASEAIRRMVQAHSYEEPAFDVYGLQSSAGRSTAGAGRMGSLPQPRPLREFAQQVKQSLRSSVVRAIGEPNREVQKVAVACGAAGEFLKDAASAKADVFLTGEMRFHDELAARAAGLALVLPGHYATERGGMERLAELLAEAFPQARAWASRHEACPEWPA